MVERQDSAERRRKTKPMADAGGSARQAVGECRGTLSPSLLDSLRRFRVSGRWSGSGGKGTCSAKLPRGTRSVARASLLQAACEQRRRRATRSFDAWRRCPKFLLTIFLFDFSPVPVEGSWARHSAISIPSPDSLLLSDTQRHALRRGWRQRHSGVRLRETEHRERERDETKNEIER